MLKNNNLQYYIKGIVISVLFGSIFSTLLTRSAQAEQPFINLVTEHLPPYQIVESDNNITGFVTDVIIETMTRSKFPFDLNSYPWVRSYNLAQTKANHCIFSIARLAYRENSFKWVGPLSKINNAVIWGLKASGINIRQLDDAKKYIIAVNRDDITHIGLLERGFVEGENLYLLDDAKSLVTLLISRPEIDLIVADDLTIDFRTKLAGITKNDLQRVFEITDLPLDFYFACSLQTDDLVIERLKDTLNSVYSDGTYQKIWTKWQDKLSDLK